MIHVRDGLTFSNENSGFAEALARWMAKAKTKRKARAGSGRNRRTTRLKEA